MLTRARQTKQHIVVVGKRVEAGKLIGFTEADIEMLRHSSAAMILIEADGAARKPLKAPAEHEPVIPKATTVVMPIVGIDCIGHPIDAATVHRPERVAQITSMKEHELITSETVAQVVASTHGYRKAVPEKARFLPFINKVHTELEWAHAQDIATQIHLHINCKILIGQAQAQDPVRKVVLP